MWKEFQFNDPASPIFDFREKAVQQILDQLRAGSNLVDKETYYPLAWGDINPMMQTMLLPILPLLLTTTVVLVGEPGRAKNHA